MRKEFVEKEEICFPQEKYEEIRNDEKQRIPQNC